VLRRHVIVMQCHARHVPSGEQMLSRLFSV
jgi:hypothetical protein